MIWDDLSGDVSHVLSTHYTRTPTFSKRRRRIVRSGPLPFLVPTILSAVAYKTRKKKKSIKKPPRVTSHQVCITCREKLFRCSILLLSKIYFLSPFDATIRGGDSGTSKVPLHHSSHLHPAFSLVLLLPPSRAQKPRGSRPSYSKNNRGHDW